VNFDFDRVVIFTPSFEQRVSKQAYSFVKRGLFTTVYAETAEVSKEFENYICDVNYVEIPVIDKIKKDAAWYWQKKAHKESAIQGFFRRRKNLNSFT
jgi:hypothetical protein